MPNADEVDLNALCAAIAAGTSFDAAGKTISAEAIRRLALSLPLEGQEQPCSVPGGIDIYDAKIPTRVELSNATGRPGAALPALIFEKCALRGGFEGAHSRFRRLSFTGCEFCDPPGEREAGRQRLVEASPSPVEATSAAEVSDGEPPLKPTVDLSGATIDSDLNFQGARPEGDILEGEAADEAYLASAPAEGMQRLWIRLRGARIGGKLDLSRARLRAPADPPKRLLSCPSIDALDLSLATVHGDLLFLNGARSCGRIMARRAHVRGDVWMTGAKLNGLCREALVFQLATIDGILILDSRPDAAAGSGPVRRFRARGQLNFHDLRVGGTIWLGDPDLCPSNVSPKPEASLLCLEGAHVGGSVRIIGSESGARIRGKLQLANLEVGQEFLISGIEMGAPAEELGEEALIHARSLIADSVTISHVRPVQSEGHCAPGLEPALQALSVDLGGATTRTLEVRESHFNGAFRAPRLNCAADVVLSARIAGEVDLEGARIGGSLDLSDLQLPVKATELNLRDGVIGGALRLTRRPRLGGQQPDLKHARRTRLRCLPDAFLLETLWEYRCGETETHRQAAFLERKGVITLLDRHPETLAEFIASYGHRVHTRAAAEEFFRLYCAYGPTQRRARWVLASHDPPPLPLAWNLEVVSEPSGSAAPQPPSQGPAGSAAALGPLDFRVRSRQRPAGAACETYSLRACLLLDDRLAWGTCDIEVGAGRVDVANFRVRHLGPKVANAPVSFGPFVDRPVAAGAFTDWVTPPALDRSEEQEGGIRKLDKRLRPYLRSGFSMRGTADLHNLSCQTLDDEGGRLWGRQVCIRMNHFVYRQALWDPEIEPDRKPTFHRFQDWLRRVAAERLWPPAMGSTWVWPRSLGWLEFGRRWRDRTDYWATWQNRRNWLFQQFSRSANLPCRSRHRVDQFQYAPQPFEQAVKVARAEGREDYATHFEMLKHRVEWQLSNRNVRWRLAPVGIAFGAAWLVYKGGSAYATFAALIVTWMLMAWASSARSLFNLLVGWAPASARALLTELTFYIPAFVGLFWLDGWISNPFDFFIAFLIYICIRFIAVFAHATMRFGFGYLRRPVRAIVTLILAFVLGWIGVHVANVRNMLVIDSEPVAEVAMPDNHAEDPYDPYRGTDNAVLPVLMGSPKADVSGEAVRELSCRATLSEPLYALDVLVPLVDLREESRCEVRRVPEGKAEEAIAGSPGEEAEPDRKDAERPEPSTMSWGDLQNTFPEFILSDNRFWWWVKALYAIAGWVIVSLALLTFAQVNRTRGEGAGMGE